MICPNTGLTIPECSCHPCLERQYDEHQASKLDDDTGSCAGLSVVDPGATLNPDGGPASVRDTAAISPPSAGAGQLQEAA
jgi:hypothetical protein